MPISPSEARSIALRVQSMIDAGQPDAALSLAEQQLGQATGEARAVLQQAQSVALTVAGRPADALRAAAASRDGFREAGSRTGEFDALIAIGAVMRSAGDHASAIKTFEDAELIARDLDDAMRLGVVLRQIGICCSIIGRHQQGLSSLVEAVKMHAGLANEREHLSTLLSLYNARNRRALSLPPDSEERRADLEMHLDNWLELAGDAGRLGLTRIELMALGNHAITLHDSGRHHEALRALSALMPRYREHAMVQNEAICHFEMARAHASLGEYGASRLHYREAIERFERNGASGELRDALEGLANVEEAIDDHRAALAALRRVRAIEAVLNESEAHRSASQRELRIELAMLSSQWHRLASIDPLTGLANRRALEQWFTETQPRIDSGEAMTVLLHDLDHFKAVNDRFGHHVGDDVLKEVARLIHANCRPHDLAVRYGGEEFLLAMIGVEHHAAVEVAERLRASVESHRWQQIVPDLRVTVSIGIAGIVETGDVAALLTLADRRLYAAKHDGRNRVIHTG